MLQVVLQNRYLIQELVVRDVRSRYIGSILGMFWSVLNPLFQLILYTIVFSLVLKVRFPGNETTAQFAQLVFCGLLPWAAFQESTIRSARGLLDHSMLIKKVRFPLEAIPLSFTFSACLHQLLGWLVFLLVLLAFGMLNPANLYLLPFMLAIQMLLMYGWGMTIACFNVFFRDISQVIGVAFMFLFWMTPIVYPLSQAPPAFQIVLSLNPLTHMIELYRYAFFGGALPPWQGIAYWIVFSMASVSLGNLVLRRTRAELLDLL